MDVDDAAVDHADELRETVQAVRVDAIAAGVGEEAGAESGAIAFKAEIQEDSRENILEFFVGNSEHGFVFLPALGALSHCRSLAKISPSGDKKLWRQMQV